MAERKKWNRDELLVLLNIYQKLPFGQFDQDQKVVQQLAEKMGRTNSSVAMKLSNLASLDPVLQARGIKGLTGASNLDREVWNEFQQDRVALAPASEEKLRLLFHVKPGDELDIIKNAGIKVRKSKAPQSPKGDTETAAQVMVRRGQQFFRQMVLNAYDGCCCITGLPVRELLVASHILPWSSFPQERLNHRNGLALSRLHDGAFDIGLITLDEDFRVVLSKDLKSVLPNEAVKISFVAYEGRRIRLPAESQPPDEQFLAFHRKKIFKM